MAKRKEDSALKMLRKLYGYDVAVVKQQGHALGDEKSELEVLAMYHLDKQIISALNEYFEYVGDSVHMESGAVSVLMGTAGVILAQIAKGKGKGKKAASKAAKLGKKYLEMQYAKLTGEISDD
jgi:hypothetical protein